MLQAPLLFLPNIFVLFVFCLVCLCQTELRNMLQALSPSTGSPVRGLPHADLRGLMAPALYYVVCVSIIIIMISSNSIIISSSGSSTMIISIMMIIIIIVVVMVYTNITMMVYSPPRINKPPLCCVSLKTTLFTIWLLSKRPETD